MSADIQLVSFQPAHYPAMARIYRQGMESGLATFETEVKTLEQWQMVALPQCRLVAVQKSTETVVGFAYLSAVSARACYAGVAEVTLYVDGTIQRQGVGRLLLSGLSDCAFKQGFWTLQSHIFSANTASIKLHQDCGFREVGLRERLGQRLGQWHDIVLMEKRRTDD